MEEHPLLSEEAIAEIVRSGLAACAYDHKRVLVLVPDLTRTMPLPLFFRLVVESLRPRVACLDFMVALGTHAPLNDAQMDQLFGGQPGERDQDYRDIGFLNHDWQNPGALTLLGTISALEIRALSEGMLDREVPVRINKRVLDYDELFVCGPVFPHEIVGISGGNKYFFPGIAGQDIIDVTHWIGASVTSYALIGTKDTPVRRVIDRAASMIPRPRRRHRGRLCRADPRSLGPSGRSDGPNPHHLGSQALSTGFVAPARDVRRDLGRCQGHVQAGTRDRRRR